MAEPGRKLAFQKSTGSWVIAQPAGDGFEVVETLTPEPEHWTGEAYDLASAHPKASQELRGQLDWYRGNMIDEPSGPLDENGKTTGTEFQQPDEPKVTTLPVQQIEGDPNAGETDVWDEIASGSGDLARGAGQGASFGLGDEGSAAVQSWLGSPMEGQRAAGRGADAPLMTPEQEQASVLANERGANAEAQERSPWLYGGGQVLGSLPSAIATAPAAGAGLAVRAGQAGMHGAALGAAHGYGASEGETDADIWQDVSDSATIGGGLGAAAPIAGAGASWVAKQGGEVLEKVADKAQRAGWRNRGVAPGNYGGELAKMTAQNGRDLVERIGRTIEKYGAHKRPESSMLPGWVPQGAGTYADTLEPAAKKAGQAIAAPIDEATAAGAKVDPKGLAASLRTAQTEHLADGQPNNKAVAKHIDDIANDLAKRFANRKGMPDGAEMSPREAWDYRHKMKPTAQLDKPGAMPEASLRGAAYREGRDVIGQSVEESLNPAQRAAYQEGNTDYAMLVKALNAATKREARETGNQIMSINDPGMAAAGAVLGGAPGAAAGIGMTEALKRVGRDASADAFGGIASAGRGLARGARAAGSALETVGDDARYIAPLAADDASAAASDDIFAGSPAFAQDEQAEPLQQTQQALGEHPEKAFVRQALRGRPAILGKWAPELQEALDGGGGEFGALMLRLSKDKDFQREVMPTLAEYRKRKGPTP
jgi:hypothetical protein